MAFVVYKFDDFSLDCGKFELCRKGRRLKLERQPLELLVLLVSNHGKIVTREEMAELLWHREVFVDTEHGINTAIRKIRRILGDDPEQPQFVQTVSGSGYRFIAPVSAVAPPLPVESTPDPALPAASPSRRRPLGWYTVAAACVALAFGGLALYRSRHRPREIRYTQLTNFTDSAVAPALSPDGRMVAFIRGGNPFLSSDHIYVKMLPNGEARRVTDDDRPKYGLAFSPDGSEIAYTVLDLPMFSTYEVSALGGEPHLLLRNAAGLVWLDPQRLLFSEFRTGEGLHLGVVTATVTRSGLREIYFPAHQRGMVHDSFPSPDRRWALVVEMNGNGGWAQCRLVGLQGQSPPRSVGPAGACTSAGWSPDGSWIYFTATVEGQSHIWRQRFPAGAPEQITFGPAEEDGVAMEPDGRALISSVGVHESALWIHDGRGERPLSSEGDVAAEPSPPAFGPNDRVVYYLLRLGESAGAELRRTVVDSGKSEAMFPGISMIAFDISPDGKEVVYATAESGGTTQLWLAPVDQSAPARRLGISGALSPHFGARGEILFQKSEGNANYLERINHDGSHRSKVFSYPIVEFQGVSPSRRWAMAVVPTTPEKDVPAVVAIPLDGGTPRHICADCIPEWSTDGKFLFVTVEEPTRTSPGRSLAVPVGPGESLPDLPDEGIPLLAQPRVVPGTESVARGELVPGRDPGQYVWVNITVHRNLYRISLP